MKDKQQKQEKIECLPEDACLRQVIVTINQIAERLNYLCGMVDSTFIAKEAVKAVQSEMNNAAIRLGILRNRR